MISVEVRASSSPRSVLEIADISSPPNALRAMVLRGPRRAPPVQAMSRSRPRGGGARARGGLARAREGCASQHPACIHYFLLILAGSGAAVDLRRPAAVDWWVVDAQWVPNARRASALSSRTQPRVGATAWCWNAATYTWRSIIAMNAQASAIGKFGYMFGQFRRELRLPV